MCVQPQQKKIEKNGYVDYIRYPCGKCPLCIKRKTTDWQIRLQEEEKRSTSAYFITLTYDDDNVPHGNNCLSLCKTDFQKWMKRLRHHNQKNGYQKLVYYGVGEYGKKTQRPHYHAIIYNLRHTDIEEVVHKSWTLGFTKILPLKAGGIGYVLKYLRKQSQKNTNREPEFSLCSKNIGANYINEQTIRFHNQSLDMCYYQKNESKFALPRYYKNKIYSEENLKELTKHQERRHKEKENNYIYEAQRKKITLEDYEKLIQYRKDLLSLPKDTSNYIL